MPDWELWLVQIVNTGKKHCYILTLSFQIGFPWIEFLFDGITSSFSKRTLLTNVHYKFLSESKERKSVINVKNETKGIGNSMIWSP